MPDCCFHPDSTGEMKGQDIWFGYGLLSWSWNDAVPGQVCVYDKGHDEIYCQIGCRYHMRCGIARFYSRGGSGGFPL